MEVQINSQQGLLPIDNQRIKSKLERILEDLACRDKELSVLFTDDRRIAQLNKRYLGRNGPTNVLAFPMNEGPTTKYESPMLGDVVISVDTALKESKALGEPLEHTIDRLLIHGILHLLGYDHEKSTAEAARMEKEEKRLQALVSEG